MAETPQAPVTLQSLPVARRRTWRFGLLRALILSGLALGAVGTRFSQTRVPRYLARLERLQGRYDAWDRSRVLSWLEKERGDPRVTAAFVHELALLGRSKIYDDDDQGARAFEQVARALSRRHPPLTDELVTDLARGFARFQAPPAGRELARALGPEAAPRLRAVAKASTEPKELRRAALLLLCSTGGGTAADVPAVIASVLGASPEGSRAFTSSSFERTKRNQPAVDALVAIGEPAVGALVRAFSRGRSRKLVSVAARALRQIDLDALIKVLEERTDAYQKAETRRALADLLLERHRYFLKNPAAARAARSGVERTVPTAKEVQAAHATVRRTDRLGILVAEGLATLQDVRDNDRVDLCFMRALSSRNQAVAKLCAKELDRRLDVDRFVDALFRFLTRKSSFAMREVAVYETAMKRHGRRASPAIVRNLDRLLRDADGRPDRVYWIHKAIGLRCLAEVGEPAAFGTLVKYAADTDSYALTRTRSQGGGLPPKKVRTIIYYRDIAKRAVLQIEKRSGQAAPPLPVAPAGRTPR